MSRARWSLWTLGRVLAMTVVALIPPDQPILVAADDTVLRHRGPKVYGRGGAAPPQQQGKDLPVESPFSIVRNLTDATSAIRAENAMN